MSFLALILAGAILGQSEAPPTKPSLSCKFTTERNDFGWCRNLGWATLEARLTNPTDKTLEGSLIIEVPPPQGSRDPSKRYSSRVRLPPKSRRKIRVPLFAEHGPDDDLFTLIRVKARLVLDEGPSLVWKSRDLRAVHPERGDELVLIVGRVDEEGGFGYLSRTPRSWRDEEEGDKRRSKWLVYGSPQGLPQDPLVLRNFDSILLSRMALWSLSRAQQEALIAYVSLGGHLIVATSREGVPHQPSLLDDILPAVPRGYAEVDGWRRMSRLFSDGEPVPGPLSVQVLDVMPGATFALWEGGRPIWVETDVGLGRVAVVAFDLVGSALPGWKCKDAFTQWLLYGPGTMPVLPRPPPGGGMKVKSIQSFVPRGWGQRRLTLDYLGDLPKIDSVLEGASHPIPPTMSVAKLVLAYLVLLVPLNYAFWRSRKRPEGAWLTAVALAILSTGGILAWGSTKGKPPLLIWELDVEGGALGGAGRLHRYRFALNTATERTVDLDVASGLRIRPEPRGLRGAATVIPEMTAVESPGIRGLRMRSQSYHYMLGEAISARPETRADRLALKNGRWQGQVDIGWDGPPDGAVLLLSKGWTLLDTKGAGGSILALDVGISDLREYQTIEWSSECQENRSSDPQVGSWAEDLKQDDPWTPVVVALLDETRSVASGLALGVPRLVAWKKTEETGLHPVGDRALARTFRCLILDMPELPESSQDSLVRWIPHIPVDDLYQAGEHLFESDLEMIPTRPVDPGKVKDLRLLFRPWSRVGFDRYRRLDGVSAYNYETRQGDPMEDLIHGAPLAVRGVPLSPVSYLEKGTGIARLQFWYDGSDTKWVVRALGLEGRIGPGEGK